MKKRNLFGNIMSVLHILLLLCCSYILFVRPHLDSATPVRDVSRDLVGIVALDRFDDVFAVLGHQKN